MRNGVLPTIVFLAVALVPSAVSSQNAPETEAPPQASFPVPENLVLDFRVFESRTESPDYSTMESLSFFINTDGRGVSATQWPSTIAKKVTETFLAALIYDTAPVKQGVSHFEWSNGSRSIKTEIRIDDYHPSGTFTAQLESQFTRGSRTTKELSRALELQMKRTSVWSSSELEMSATDYLSHFREYKDRESRGLLYEQLRPYSFFLVMAVTPRLLTAEEAAPPRALSLPAGAEPPVPADAPDLPLRGTIVLGFHVDASGAPVSPQVLRSTLPEANLVVIAQASAWRFPVSDDARRGELEIKLEHP